MGPPTLEQVLNRSLAPGRATRILKKLAVAPPQDVPSIFPAKKSSSSTSGDGASSSSDGRGSASSTAGRAARDLAKEAQLSREAEFVRPMREAKNTSQDLTSLLEAATSVGDWESAIESFAHALENDRHFLPSPEQTQLVVRVAVANGAPLDLIELPLLESLSEKSAALAVPPHDSTGLDAHERDEVGAGNPDSPSPPQSSLQTAAAELTRAYAEADECDRALAMVRHASAASSTGFAAVQVYAAAIEACERTSRWEEALGLYSDMISSPSSKPDAVAYAALLAAMEAAERPAEARAVLKLMPGREQDEVVASYAALLHTWSSRHAQRSMKRF